MEWLPPVAYAIIALSILYPLARRSYFTGSFVVANLAIFLLVNLLMLLQPDFLSRLRTAQTILQQLAFRPADLTSLRFDTLITSMYLHLSILHVLGNVIFLYLLGLPLEERIGSRRFALLYLTTGIAATLLYSMVRWNSTIPALGASGAVMGIAGALLALYPREEIPMFLGPIFLPRVRVSYAVTFILVYQVIMAALGVQDGVAYAAHIGGIVAGIFLGPLVHRPEPTAAVRPVNLEDLATTAELKALLEDIRKESVLEVRDAWVDHFLKKASCPRCGGPLVRRGSVVESDCGWRRRL